MNRETTTSQGETDQVPSRERWDVERAFREREVALKERELAIKADEQKSGKWRNPLTVAILAAALAAAGNGIVAMMNGIAQRELEAERADQARILEVIKVGDPDKAATNLQFLLDSGLIRDAILRESLARFLASRKPGTGPFIASDLLARYLSDLTEFNRTLGIGVPAENAFSSKARRLAQTGNYEQYSDAVRRLKLFTLISGLSDSQRVTIAKNQPFGKLSGRSDLKAFEEAIEKASPGDLKRMEAAIP